MAVLAATLILTEVGRNRTLELIEGFRGDIGFHAGQVHALAPVPTAEMVGPVHHERHVEQSRLIQKNPERLVEESLACLEVVRQVEMVETAFLYQRSRPIR